MKIIRQLCTISFLVLMLNPVTGEIVEVPYQSGPSAYVDQLGKAQATEELRQLEQLQAQQGQVFKRKMPEDFNIGRTRR